MRTKIHWQRTVGSRPSHEGRGLKYQNGLGLGDLVGRPSHEGRGLKLARYTGKSEAEIRRPSHEGRGLKLLGRLF